MIVYEIHTPRLTQDKERWFEPTKAAAHAWVKQNVPAYNFSSTSVVERNLRDDKAGVLLALNGAPEFSPAERSWYITPRGGMKEEGA